MTKYQAVTVQAFWSGGTGYSQLGGVTGWSPCLGKAVGCAQKLGGASSWAPNCLGSLVRQG